MECLNFVWGCAKDVVVLEASFLLEFLGKKCKVLGQGSLMTLAPSFIRTSLKCNLNLMLASWLLISLSWAAFVFRWWALPRLIYHFKVVPWLFRLFLYNQESVNVWFITAVASAYSASNWRRYRRTRPVTQDLVIFLTLYADDVLCEHALFGNAGICEYRRDFHIFSFQKPYHSRKTPTAMIELSHF
jgi:hypothetical protein